MFRVKTVPASLHCSLVWPNANPGVWGLTSRISPKWAVCALLFGFFQAADWRWSIPTDTQWPWGRKPCQAEHGEKAPGSQLPYSILLAPHHWPLDLAGRGTSVLFKSLILDGNSLAIQWLGLYTFTPGTQVQSLVGELRSCKPCGKTLKKKKNPCFWRISFICNQTPS